MSRSKKSASASVVEAGPQLWDRISDRTQHAVCLVLLTLVSLSFFAPLHFGGRSLIGSDTVNWRATAESVLQYERETGEPALWATNVFAGMPAYMISYRTVVPQLDTVISRLRPYLWPSSNFVVLLFGTYLLVFFLTRNKWAGVLAAIAFGLTTYLPVLLVAGHNSKFIALCWAPWLLLAFAYVLSRPRVLTSVLFAIALAINLRAGHFQITYYVLFVMLVWWVGQGIQAFRTGTARHFVMSTVALLCGGVLAAMMVAQPYLSQYEYKAFTVRGASTGGGEGGLAWDYAMAWSQGVGELITLVIADAYGGSEAYWGAKPFTGGPHYITAIVALLALVGAVRSKTVAARSLGVSAVLILLFSLGSNLALVNRPMFNFFPLFSAFRVPETWLAALALVTAVLAGLGVQCVLDEARSLSWRSFVTRAYIALVAILVVAAVAGQSTLEFEKEGERDAVMQQIARGNNVSPDDPRVGRTADEFLTDMRADRRSKFTADAWRSIIALLIAGGITLAYRGRRLPSAVLQSLFALVVLIDLWGVDRRYLNDTKLGRSSDVETAIPEYGFDRFILDREAEDSNRFRVLSLEGAPTVTARPSYFYESLSGYHGAKLRLYQDYIDHLLVSADGMLNIQGLRLMNTRYVVARGMIPQTERVFTDEKTGFSVFEVDGFLPRAFFVDSLARVQSAEEAWDLLRSPDVDLRQVGVVEEDLSVAPAKHDTTGRTKAAVTSYSPRRIEIDATTDHERLLVVSEVYYPAGWSADVDGEAARIHRVDYLLRGIVVPSGTHQIVLTFDPASHRVGVWVAAASTFFAYGLVILIVGTGLMRSRAAGKEEPPH